MSIKVAWTVHLLYDNTQRRRTCDQHNKRGDASVDSPRLLWMSCCRHNKWSKYIMAFRHKRLPVLVWQEGETVQQRSHSRHWICVEVYTLRPTLCIRNQSIAERLYRADATMSRYRERTGHNAQTFPPIQSEHVSGAWAERKTERSGRKTGWAGAERWAGIFERERSGAG